MRPPIYSQFSKQGTISMPKQLPRFEGKENCTITIRIPRLYLKDSEREKVCSRRAVWGTDIYTDDSDPLAAAIHSGWIRGKWAAGIDTSMLEVMENNFKSKLSSSLERSINSKTIKVVAGTTNANDQLIYTTAPPEPLLPIPGKDLHLTLLILPTLQSYASLVRHGIKSRPLGSNATHGGMSFAIEKVVWRDGGRGSGEERGGEARRKRMRTMDWMGGRVGPPVRLNMTESGLATAVQG